MVYCMAFWGILWSFGIIFSRFGMFYREKSGNPGRGAHERISAAFQPKSRKGVNVSKNCRSKSQVWLDFSVYLGRYLHNGSPKTYMVIWTYLQVMNSTLRKSDEARVTRLGEFSTIGRPLGDCFLAFFLIVDFLAIFARSCSCFRYEILAKNELGYILGDFFHKIIWSH
jgi:hypothetical protein